MGIYKRAAMVKTAQFTRKRQFAYTFVFYGVGYKNYVYMGFFSKLLAQRGTYRPVELIVGEIGQKFRSPVMKIGDFCKKLANLDIKVRV